MPMRVVEVDQIDGGYSAVVERDVIVFDRRGGIFVSLKACGFQLDGGGVYLLDKTRRLEPRILLDGKSGIFSRDHVEKHGASVAYAALGVEPGPCGEMPTAMEIVVFLIEHELFAVKADKVDSVNAFDGLRVPGQFHEKCHAGTAVVGAQKRRVAFGAVGFLIGAGACVVVGAQDDSVLFFRVDPGDQVGHFHRGARAFAGGLKPLKRNVETLSFEMFFEHLLLFLHAGRPTYAGADSANGGKIFQCPLRIEWYLMRGSGNAVLREGVGPAFLWPPAPSQKDTHECSHQACAP